MAPWKTRRMRSTAISIGLVGALAASLAGGGTGSQSDTRRRVDTDSYDIVSDDLCANPTPTTGRGAGSRPVGWYYGGRVSGGTTSAPSGVETGGFGAKGSGGSGGGS